MHGGRCAVNLGCWGRRSPSQVAERCLFTLEQSLIRIRTSKAPFQLLDVTAVIALEVQLLDPLRHPCVIGIYDLVEKIVETEE